MRVLKETVSVTNEESGVSATLTGGLREDEVKQIAPWALKRGVIPAKQWQKVKGPPKDGGT